MLISLLDYFAQAEKLVILLCLFNPRSMSLQKGKKIISQDVAIIFFFACQTRTRQNLKSNKTPEERVFVSRSRNHANEKALKYLAISLLSTPIHSEHAALSCCSREHFQFDFELLHDVLRFIHLSREEERAQKAKQSS